MSMVSAVTWKSTIVVSGLGVLATWLASVPANRTPAVAVAPASMAAAGTAGHASDIEQQAARLQLRARHEVDYQQPSRNLFRFTARSASPSRTAATPPAPVIVAAAPPAPEPLRIKLSGVASDLVSGVEQRTAILSTPSGVVLAREGDEVGGQFRVGKITEDAVDLVRLADGSPIHLQAR